MDIPIHSQILNGSVLILELVLSLGVGIYYGVRQKTSEEYIRGGRKMSLLPVCMSMAVTFTSAISIQGLPAEVYVYGIEICFYSFAFLAGILIIFTFLPIFYELKLTSVYEYFLLRYNSRVLYKCASFLGCLIQIMYSALVILGPAEAVESLFGIPTVYNIFMISSICIIYTSIGGIQGVIWTDVVQSCIMFSATITVILFGLINIGVKTIWKELSDNGRTALHYSPDIRNRTSIWLFMYNLTSVYHCFTMQSAVARYTGVKNIKQAKFVIIYGCVGILAFDILSISAGAIVFAFYSLTGCGPLESKAISSVNQILPYFVMNELNYPGLPGLFVAALIAAGLSTASSTLNAAAIVCLQDFILPLYPNVSEPRKNILLKGVTVIIGCLTIAVSYACKFSPGSIVEMFATVINSLVAPIGTAFIIAATIPFSGPRAILIGGICGLILPMWINVGTMVNDIRWEKPAPIDEMCTIAENASTTDIPGFTYQNSDTNVMENGLFYSLYSICPFSYSLIGSATTFIVGTCLSLFPCFRNSDKVEQRLLFPFITRCMNRNPPENTPGKELREQSAV